MVFIVCNVELE